MNFENEINYAKHLENINFSKDSNYFPKCVTLVRYWRTIGKSEELIFNNLYNILKNIYFDFGDNIILVDIENILNIASCKGILQEKRIQFSKEELDYIHRFNHLNFEKLLFIMFCAYKVEDTNKFTAKGKEIMRYSCNGYSHKYCNELLGKSFKCGAFDMGKFDNSLKYYPTEFTLSLFNPSNIVLDITNFKNLVYYYLNYIKEGKFIYCEKCGCIEKKKSNNQNFCSECSIINKNEWMKINWRENKDKYIK